MGILSPSLDDSRSTVVQAWTAECWSESEISLSESEIGFLLSVSNCCKSVKVQAWTDDCWSESRTAVELKNDERAIIFKIDIPGPPICPLLTLPCNLYICGSP